MRWLGCRRCSTGGERAVVAGVDSRLEGAGKVAFGTECGGGVGGSEHDGPGRTSPPWRIELGSAAFGAPSSIVKPLSAARCPARSSPPRPGARSGQRSPSGCGYRRRRSHTRQSSEVGGRSRRAASATRQALAAATMSFRSLAPRRQLVGNDGDPQRTDLTGAAAEPGLVALDPRETSGSRGRSRW